MRVVVAVIWTAGLVGCTPVWEGRARGIPAETWQRPVVAQAVAAHDDQAAEPASDPVVTAPRNLKDLDDLVAWGLERHPGVRARLSAVERLAHQVGARGSLPPPQLQIAPFGKMAQTAAGEVTLMAGISQQFPAPGRLSATVAQVEAEVRAAEAAVHAERVNTALRIRTSWWNWHMARDSRAIVDEQLALLQQLRRQMLQGLEAGTGKQSDALRIGVEIDRMRSMQLVWDERRVTAEANLRQALSLPHTQAIPRIPAALAQAQRYQEADLLALARIYRADILGNLAKRERAAARRAHGLGATATGFWPELPLQSRR